MVFGLLFEQGVFGFSLPSGFLVVSGFLMISILSLEASSFFWWLDKPAAGAAGCRQRVVKICWFGFHPMC